MKNMIFAGVVFLSIFSNLHGMRRGKAPVCPPISQGIKGFYYGNENLIFNQLTKDQCATIMLMILEEPGVTVQRLKDAKNNNVFHLILSSYDTLTPSLVMDAFRACLLHPMDDTMLKEKNASGQSPLDLINGLVDEGFKKFCMESINGQEEVEVAPSPWPTESAGKEKKNLKELYYEVGNLSNVAL